MKTIKLLYVDDEPINIFVFQKNFEAKYNIITASSGDEALNVLNHNDDINVLISDMKMPFMNGIELIKIVKQRYPKIVCFLLTGFEITPEIAVALNEKIISKYFRKPFNRTEIEMAINQLHLKV